MTVLRCQRARARRFGVRLLAALWMLGLVLEALPAARVEAAEGTWSQVNTSGPQERTFASMAYDSSRAKVVLFGGRSAVASPVSSAPPLGDTYTWDAANNWVKQNPSTNPPARWGASMAYDAATQSTLLFGGTSEVSLVQDKLTSGDTWQWDGANWNPQTPASPSPPPRFGAAMAYDEATQTVVLFGGQGVPDGSNLQDTWTWDGKAWTQHNPNTIPSATVSSTMAYDAASGTMLLLTGDGSYWAWDGTNWTQLHPTGTALPVSDSGTAMAYDESSGGLVLYAGNTPATWLWSGGTWTKRAPADQPPHRSGASIAYDAATNSDVLFGGQGEKDPNAPRLNGYRNDTWTWTGAPVVKATSTTTTIVASQNPISADQVVTFTARVAPDPGDSRVAFYDDGGIITSCAAIQLKSGQATCRTALSVSGRHQIRAAYLGDADHAASVSAVLNETVEPSGSQQTVTTLSSSSNPSAAGATVTLTARVTPIPDGGVVTFQADGRGVTGCDQVPMLSGAAECSPRYDSPQTHAIVARYQGNFVYQPSEAGITQAVLNSAIGGRALGTWTSAGLVPAVQGSNTMTVLDGPACRVAPTASYCGDVLVVSNDSAGGSAVLVNPLTRTVTPTGHLILPRAGGATVLIDGPDCHVVASVHPDYCGDVLIAGGQTATGVTASAEIYDPKVTGLVGGIPVEGSWHATSSLGTPRVEHTMTLLNGAHCGTLCGMVLVAGGYNESQLGTCFAYNVAFQCKDPSGGALYDAVGKEPTGQLAPTLGRHSPLLAVELYDPASGSWRSGGSLFHSRIDAAATQLDGAECSLAAAPPYCGKVLVTGGFGDQINNGSQLASYELFDPTAQTWARGGGAMQVGRGFHAATLLTGPACGQVAQRPRYCGRVLIAGGTDAFSALSSAELYDPEGDSFSPTGSMHEPRNHTSAVRLTGGSCAGAGAPSFCGSVLVVAGVDDETGAAKPQRPQTISLTAELYDPVAGSWQMTGSLLDARSGESSVVLAGSSCAAGGAPSYCGQVMVAGGTAAAGPGLDTLELFDPRALAQPPSLISLAPAEGPMNLGTAVELSAGGVDETTHVSFGDTLAPHRIDSARRVAAVSPPQAGPRAVSVGLEKSGMRSFPLATNRFEYGAARDLETPAITGVTPPVGPPGGGNAITITGTGLFRPGVRLAVGGSPAKVTFLSDTQATLTAPPHAKGVVDVTALDGGGHGSPASVGDRYTYAEGGWSGLPPLSICPQAQCDAVRGASSALQSNQRCSPQLPGQNVGGVEVQTDPFCTPTPALDTCPSAMAALPLPCGLVGHTATLLDPAACHQPSPPPAYPCGRVLVAGGSDESGATFAQAELYDPAHAVSSGTGAWTATGSLLVARRDHTATLLPDGRVLVAGGLTAGPANQGAQNGQTVAGAAGHGLAEAEVYDPTSGSWTAVAPMSMPRFLHSATLLEGGGCSPSCGRVLVVGGSPSELLRSAPTTVAELFDPTSNTWTPTGSLATGRQSHTATLLADGTVLVAGGLANSVDPSTLGGAQRAVALTSAEVYDPSAGTWTTVGGMVQRRFDHTASLLSGPACALQCGMVLLAGGDDGSAFIPDAELYDPGARRFQSTGRMHDGRAGQTATLLPNGQVLVAGAGLSVPHTIATTDPIGSSELYDPSTGGWSYTLPLQMARGYHTATLLDGPACRQPGPSGAPAYCGSVLAAAGIDAVDNVSGRTVATAELYTPSPDVLGLWPTEGSARGGTEVVITGSGLNQGSTVSFGDLPARSVTLDSPTRIRAVSPAHPIGPVGVTVHNSAGDSSATQPNPAAVFSYNSCDLPPLPGQISYPARTYSLIGLPGGTLLQSDSPLYSWVNQGGGHGYTVQDPNQAATVAGQGYWAWFECSRPIALGPGRASTSSQLDAKHASMVGNPSSTSPATVSGFDFSARWDPSANGGLGGYQISGYRQAQSLRVGEGIWVFSYRSTTVSAAAAAP